MNLSLWFLYSRSCRSCLLILSGLFLIVRGAAVILTSLYFKALFIPYCYFKCLNKNSGQLFLTSLKSVYRITPGYFCSSYCSWTLWRSRNRSIWANPSVSGRRSFLNTFFPSSTSMYDLLSMFFHPDSTFCSVWNTPSNGFLMVCFSVRN